MDKCQTGVQFQQIAYTPPMRTLIKDPLAILADNAKGGVVVEDSKIVECLNAGEAPTQLCDEIFDAS
ncbi:MAG: hypothetical protein VX156_01355, partial [Pseudomonadota bacterium]|nr:hypothetical protein [Pseudomonadota bacterium]